jgi:AraC family transcriptional regulator
MEALITNKTLRNTTMRSKLLERSTDRREWKALETVHAVSRAQVLSVSPANAWEFVTASRFLASDLDVAVPALGVPAFGVVYSDALAVERQALGQSVSGLAGAGHLAVLPPEAETRWTFDQPGEFVLVYLSDRLLRRASEEAFDRDSATLEILPRFLIRDLVLEGVAHQLLRQMMSPNAHGRLSADQLAQRLALHLIGAHSNRQTIPCDQSCAMAPRRLARAKDYVESNLGRDISLQELADVAGMSIFHFAKMFRLATGAAPNQYVMERRVSQARALLHRSHMSVSQVGQAVGYYSRTHFSLMFRRHMGMSPSEFRMVLRT